ncbi:MULTISPECIES: MerR family transcriptional regulator [Nocardia]|uniref:MerR family transcriptional regulator n=2 Tax=Nocardia TaxID=1817 RepID=K0EVC2_NOCB7|nr:MULTISPECIES: MerR family transcriptional regulator [Nocardia]AFU01542.1 MerR family transcriptional regulator [Nocardia brasiliensis ATCC 700358]KIA62564.1 MerR family transcriptional regulator [Nocardia vulneris]OCF85939.1 MerR family transcriptional regulator [Nocardia brasiliensis]
MSIGSVLDLLRPDFPDVTISKIRFLEAEGLIRPERTPSGYRRFSVADCERLRFVLTAQRDQYLPLKVIKEQLEAIDSGAASLGVREARARAHSGRTGAAEPTTTGSASGHPAASGGNSNGAAAPRRLGVVPSEISPDDLRFDHEIRLTRADLLAKAEIDDAFLNDLIRANLITPGAAGFFDGDAVTLAKTAKAMAEFGLEARHLRAFKLAADREAALVAQIAAPIAKSRDAGARARAEETVRELAALSLTLHACLVKSSVRTSLGG